jgi:hypothetical protein
MRVNKKEINNIQNKKRGSGGPVLNGKEESGRRGERQKGLGGHLKLIFVDQS